MNGYLIYSFTRGNHGSPDEHIGENIIWTPLSRRFELGIITPFIDSLDPGKSSFGDIIISSRVMLHETKDLRVTSGMTVRTPTGNTVTNNGRTDLDPFAEVWADIGNAWQLRGGLDVDVPVDRIVLPALPEAVLTVSLALGKSFTWDRGGRGGTSPKSRRTWSRPSLRTSTVAPSRITPSST